MVRVRLLAAVLICVVAPWAVHAQGWQPNKPITIVIPFPPGRGSIWWRGWSATRSRPRSASP